MRTTADAFGNALGYSLAGASTSGTSGTSASATAEHEDNDARYRLPGQYVTGDNADVAHATPAYIDNDTGYMLPGQYVVTDNPDAVGNRRAITVSKGEGPLAAFARAGLDAQQAQAMYGQLLRNGKITRNSDGVPIVHPGQVLNVDLDDVGALKLGGQAIGNESAHRAAQRAAADAQWASTGNDVMSHDAAYARYMADGGRSAGYLRHAGSGLHGLGDGMDLLAAEFGGYSGQGTVNSSIGAFNQGMAAEKEAILQAIADRRLGWGTAVLAEMSIPGNFFEGALGAASPIVGKVAGTAVNALNKLPVLGADLGVAASKFADNAGAWGQSLLDNLSTPRPNPQFGGVLVDSGVGGGSRAVGNTALSPASEVKLGLQTLDPTTVGFTQNSVSYGKAGASYNFDTLVQSMSKNGWVGRPIDVVAMPDGTLASIDNTRVLAARQAGINVEANVRGFDEAITDPARQLSLTEKGNVPDTWGDAALSRINKPVQNATYPGMNPGWSVRFPYGSIYDPVVKY